MTVSSLLLVLIARDFSQATGIYFLHIYTTIHIYIALARALATEQDNEDEIITILCDTGTSVRGIEPPPPILVL